MQVPFMSFYCMNSQLENRQSIIDAKYDDNVKQFDDTTLDIKLICMCFGDDTFIKSWTLFSW